MGMSEQDFKALVTAEVETQTAEVKTKMAEMEVEVDKASKKAKSAEKELDRIKAEGGRVTLGEAPEVDPVGDYMPEQQREFPRNPLHGKAAQVADMVHAELTQKGSTDIRDSRLLGIPYFRKAWDKIVLPAVEQAVQTKALDTVTATGGLEWSPVAWSDSINELVFNAGRVYSNFERIPMPAKTLTVPSQAAWGTAVLIAENTDMTVNVFADGLSGVSANYSFVAKKLGTAVHMSYEIEQDALPATLAAIPRIAARSMIRGIEDAIINGDTATGSGGIDTDVTSATSVRKAFNGLRKQAVVGGTGQFTAANCNTNVNGAALTGDMLAAHIGKAGEWGLDPSDLIWVCGPNVRSQLLTLPDKNGHALMSTVDKYGPQATILKGEVGNIFGIPVIPSPMMREDLGPEGVYTSGYGAYNQATYGTLLLVYKGAWGIGDRLQMRQEYFAFQIAQASQLASTVRLDFQNALPHFPTCTMLYGIEVHA